MALRLGKISGIPITLDYSWFIIFILIAWTVGFGLGPTAYPGLGQLAYVAIGIASSILLFVSVLIHELAHSIVAKRNGLKIKQITLFIFGGVSQMEEEPQNPSLELRMSLAGPLTSLALAILLEALFRSSVLLKASPLIQAPLNYAALVNEVVAVFNLIPAFPMDGGRVLRSLIWRKNNDFLRATRLATAVGRGIAYVIMFAGIFFIFTADFFSGLWLIIIGWFISSSAQGALTQTVIQEELGSLTAADVMTRRVDAVSLDITLEELSQEFMRLKHNGFPVLVGGDLQGCVTVEDLRKVGRELWSSRKVGDIMTRREKLITAGEGEPATRALLLMRSNSVGRVFVLSEEGKLAGIITRSDIVRTLQFSNIVLQTERVSSYGGTSFTVESGMNFVLEQPTSATMDWRADYDANGARLVNEQRIRRPDGKEFKQFVFQALKPGVLIITLQPSATLEGGKEGQKPVAAAKYTIKVTNSSGGSQNRSQE